MNALCGMASKGLLRLKTKTNHPSPYAAASESQPASQLKIHLMSIWLTHTTCHPLRTLYCFIVHSINKQNSL